MELRLKHIGTDGFGRPVYKDQEGNLFKDTNLGMGSIALATVSGGFEGEPDTPIDYIKKYENVKIVIEG